MPNALTVPNPLTTQGAAAPIGLALMIGFALLGGVILNLMPCVFPVLGLKLLGLAKASGNDAQFKGAALRSSLMFALGIMLTFWLLAAAMIALQSAGESVGWGFQLQSPWFVAAMAWLFTLIALNLFGVFEIGVRLTQIDGGSHSWRDFGSGVIAVLVATPCTAPFMGAALGGTLSEGPLVKFLVFTALGLGMALPYVLLTAAPGATKWLPKPGAWMQTLKEVLAFPMLATVAWLAWVLSKQAGDEGILMLLFSLVVLSVAAWAYGRWQQRSLQGKAGVIYWQVTSVLALIAATWLVVPSLQSIADPPSEQSIASTSANSSVDGWQAWSPTAVQMALAQGNTVFVDFTAAWCVSCQVNKKVVLERASVVDSFAVKKVVKLRADWTNRNTAITQELARFGRNGVPLYQVWKPGRPEPLLLPEVLTTSIVLDALK